MVVPKPMPIRTLAEAAAGMHTARNANAATRYRLGILPFICVNLPFVPFLIYTMAS